MENINNELTAMCPSCYGNFFNNLNENAIYSIYEDYLEREKKINYYIKLIREIYQQYNIKPFKKENDNSPSLAPNFQNKTMKRRLKIIDELRKYGVSNGLSSSIKRYISRRIIAYFPSDYNYEFIDYLEEYAYFQGLDHLISKLKSLVEKELDYHAKKGIKTTEKKILTRYISTLFPKKEELETDYNEEHFYTDNELLETGYNPEETLLEEEYHRLDDFLGPKGPKL